MRNLSWSLRGRSMCRPTGGCYTRLTSPTRHVKLCYATSTVTRLCGLHGHAAPPNQQKISTPPKFLSRLHCQVLQVIRAKDLLHANDHILIAVSGGQLMTDLARARAWRLQVVHCDHRWRVDSGANAVHVAGLADRWGLPFHLRSAPDPPPRTEASAREWRYEAMSKLALELGCNVVLTGHTATDRAETLLVNLIRGAGADGMQALAWSRPLNQKVTLVRPLMNLGRHQTLELCQQLGLPIWEDSTNSDNRYQRNRIRNELIPYLREHFNPRADEALARTAEVLQDEVELLEEGAAELLNSCLASPADADMAEEGRSAKAHRLPAAALSGLQGLNEAQHLPAAASSSQQGLSAEGLEGPGVGASSCPTSPQRRLAVNLRILSEAPVALRRRAMRQLMSSLDPNVSLTHGAVEEVLQLLFSVNGKHGGSAESTGTLPRGMRAWVWGDLLVVEARPPPSVMEPQSPEGGSAA